MKTRITALLLLAFTALASTANAGDKGKHKAHVKKMVYSDRNYGQRSTIAPVPVRKAPMLPPQPVPVSPVLPGVPPVIPPHHPLVPQHPPIPPIP